MQKSQKKTHSTSSLPTFKVRLPFVFFFMGKICFFGDTIWKKTHQVLQSSWYMHRWYRISKYKKNTDYIIFQTLLQNIFGVAQKIRSCKVAMTCITSPRTTWWIISLPWDYVTWDMVFRSNSLDLLRTLAFKSWSLDLWKFRWGNFYRDENMDDFL